MGRTVSRPRSKSQAQGGQHNKTDRVLNSSKVSSPCPDSFLALEWNDFRPPAGDGDMAGLGREGRRRIGDWEGRRKQKVWVRDAARTRLEADMDASKLDIEVM